LQVVDNPDLIYADTAEPVLKVIALQGFRAIDAIERGETEVLLLAADQLAEAYCGLP
jgi:hypothetical protein